MRNSSPHCQCDHCCGVAFASYLWLVRQKCWECIDSCVTFCIRKHNILPHGSMHTIGCWRQWPMHITHFCVVRMRISMNILFCPPTTQTKMCWGHVELLTSTCITTPPTWITLIEWWGICPRVVSIPLLRVLGHCSETSWVPRLWPFYFCSKNTRDSTLCSPTKHVWVALPSVHGDHNWMDLHAISISVCGGGRSTLHVST